MEIHYEIETKVKCLLFYRNVIVTSIYILNETILTNSSSPHLHPNPGV